MKQIKRILLTIAMSSLFIIVFNVLAFLLADKLDENFWCGYIFITLSWICLLIVEVMAASKENSGKSVFLNAPGILVAVLHLGIQTIIGICVMAISFLSVKVAVCFQIIIFAIYLGIWGSLEIYKGKNK